MGGVIEATVHAPGDEVLVRSAAAGDADAFDALVAPRLDRCYRLAFAILGSPADAADATQDGVLAAWRELPRLRDPRAFDGWLNRIVANAARMVRRHRVRLREVHLQSPEGLGGNVATAGPLQVTHPADAILSADAFAKAFRRLREHERVLMVLHHVEGRPVVEIAQTLGIPVGTTKSRLHAARKALERALEAES